MPPRRRPGPKKVYTPINDDARRRKRGKQAPIPLLASFASHLVADANSTLTAGDVFLKWKGWLSLLPRQILHNTDWVKVDTAGKKLVCTQLHISHVQHCWDSHSSVYHIRYNPPVRPSPDRFDPSSYLQSDQAVSTYRALSNIANAGQGLFAARYIFSGEIVECYLGVMKLLNTMEYEQLKEKHEDNGNGTVEVGKGPSGTIYVLDPYEINGVEVPLDEARGVWANHVRDGQVGNNIKTLKFGSQMLTKMFLVARHDIPANTELCWDYGIRDPTLAWT